MGELAYQSKALNYPKQRKYMWQIYEVKVRVLTWGGLIDTSKID